MWAAALASTVTRRASSRAFRLQQRAMTSPDVLQQIGPAFQDFCDSDK
jgi:NAD(P)H-hydrate repair Nnr-like enzyme with NAD(P)H-hydrate dehydratase domain